jgi:transposase
MKAEGLGVSEIAKALKIGRAPVYRMLGAYNIDITSVSDMAI